MGRVASVERSGKDASGRRQGGVDVGTRQDDREFVAAHAKGSVVPAQRSHHRPPNGHEELVAAGMAALVVDPFQVVDVDQQERDRRTGPRCMLELPSQLFLEGPVVAEHRQPVERGVEAGAAVQLAQPRVLLVQASDIAQEWPREDRHDSRHDQHAQEQEDRSPLRPRVPRPARSPRQPRRP